jgi:hypothetical protein
MFLLEAGFSFRRPPSPYYSGGAAWGRGLCGCPVAGSCPLTYSSTSLQGYALSPARSAVTAVFEKNVWAQLPQAGLGATCGGHHRVSGSFDTAMAGAPYGGGSFRQGAGGRPCGAPFAWVQFCPANRWGLRRGESRHAPYLGRKGAVDSSLRRLRAQPWSRASENPEDRTKPLDARTNPSHRAAPSQRGVHRALPVKRQLKKNEQVPRLPVVGRPLFRSRP